MLALFLLALTISWAQQHLLHPINYCNLAAVCVHDNRPVCASEGCIRRNFLDQCDMYEYNCDYSTRYQETYIPFCLGSNLIVSPNEAIEPIEYQTTIVTSKTEPDPRENQIIPISDDVIAQSVTPAKSESTVPIKYECTTPVKCEPPTQTNKKVITMTTEQTTTKTTSTSTATSELVSEITTCCDRPKTWETTDTEASKEFRTLPSRTSRLITMLSAKRSKSSSTLNFNTGSSSASTLPTTETTMQSRPTKTFKMLSTTPEVHEKHSTCCDRPKTWETSEIPDTTIVSDEFSANTIGDQIMILTEKTTIPSLTTTESTTMQSRRTKTHTTLITTSELEEKHTTCCDRPKTWETTEIPYQIIASNEIWNSSVDDQSFQTENKTIPYSEEIPTIASTPIRSTTTSIKNNTSTMGAISTTVTRSTTGTKSTMGKISATGKKSTTGTKSITETKSTSGTKSISSTKITSGTKSTSDTKSITGTKRTSAAGIISTTKSSSRTPFLMKKLTKMDSHHIPLIHENPTIQYKQHESEGCTWWYPKPCRSKLCQRPVTWLTTVRRKKKKLD